MRFEDFEQYIPGVVLGDWNSIGQAVKHGHNRVISYLDNKYSMLRGAGGPTLINLATIAAVNGRLDLVQMFAASGVIPSLDVLPRVVAHGHGKVWEYLINTWDFPQIDAEQMYVCYPHFKHLVTPDLVDKFNHTDVIKHLVRYDCVDELKELYPILPIVTITDLLRVACTNDSLKCFKYLIEYTESKNVQAYSRAVRDMVLFHGGYRTVMWFVERYPCQRPTSIRPDHSIVDATHLYKIGSSKLFEALRVNGYDFMVERRIKSVLRYGTADILQAFLKDGHISPCDVVRSASVVGVDGGLKMFKTLVKAVEDDYDECDMVFDVFQQHAENIYKSCVEHKQFATMMYFLKDLQIRVPIGLHESLIRMARDKNITIGPEFLNVLKDYFLF